MNEFAVPLQVLDDALGFPLTPQYVHKAKPDLALCERLYFALRDYHRRNTIQPLDRRFHRPNLSFVGAGSSVLVNTAFDGYAVNSFIPRNGETTLPIDDIKRALVYADAVIVEDPVFAFCRMVMCHRLQEAKPSFRALTQALEQLAQMRPLLEHQLLRLTAYFPEPIPEVWRNLPSGAGGPISVRDMLAGTDYQDPRVLAVLDTEESLATVAGDDRRGTTLAISELMKKYGDDFKPLYRQAESVIYARQHGEAYAPFLAGRSQRRTFERLMTLMPEVKDGRRIRHLAQLNTRGVIDPSKISFDELVSVRLREESFAEWRKGLDDAIQSAQQRSEEDALDIDDFHEEMVQLQNHWDKTARKYNDNQRVAALITGAKNISIDAVGGFITGAVSGGPTLGALASLVFGPLVGIEREWLHYRADKAVAGFFTAVDSADSA